MKLIILLLISSQLFSASLSNKNYGTAIVDEVTSIYDGDTFRANIKGYPQIVGNRMSIRINGIDTPEMRGKCQKEKELARKAKQITVKALRGAKTIKLKNMKRGKYFRIVADVYTDNRSVGQLLINSGLAVKYDGGTKVMNWCKK
jgi:micrococcal nuclease